MLKSTHRVAAASTPATALPPDWTEHRAPTGHVYYYNTDTKQSTYTRPVAVQEPEELLIDYGATQPDREMQASMSAMQQFYNTNDPNQPAPGRFNGGRTYQDRGRDGSRPNRQGDRPKSKTAIPDCAPWILVKTKYARRFVHNTETKESLWKFPSEVMMAVIDMDRVVWEKQKQKQSEEAKEQQSKMQDSLAKDTTAIPYEAQPKPDDYDSNEYEEVEVTDDEADDQDQSSKRPRLDDLAPDHDKPSGPQEFDEDDIAWQLAQMEADEEDPGYDLDDPEGYDDEDGGIPLTRDDRHALFRTLLDDQRISPFSTFDALIDTNTPTANAVISDDRWLALANMSSRRAAFDTWSRDRVAERNAQESTGTDNVNGSSKSTKIDPRISYLRFLSREATPKLYWPEFKRKFRKASEMTDRYYPDKDREKLYREYVTKLKLSEPERKREFNSLLKSIDMNQWKEAQVPSALEKDLRFYGVRDEDTRTAMVDAFSDHAR